MLYLGIAKIYGLNKKLISLLCEKEKETFEKIKNEEHRLEYLYSHALLKLMRQEILGFSDGEIFYTDNGKPYFDNQKEDFSISHTQGAVAVLISDKKNIKLGVDIQNNEEQKEKYARIEKRFSSHLSSINMKNTEKNVIIQYYNLQNQTFEKNSLKLRKPKMPTFIYKWTRLEAFLKMRGTGFFDTPPYQMGKCNIQTLVFEKYTVSLASEDF
jgi:phosphopantetheinyl transferase